MNEQVLVPLPGATAREVMFRKLLSDRVGEEVDFTDLASKTEGYSGSDIKLLCKEAAMRPLRKLMAKLEGLDSMDSTVGDDKYYILYFLSSCFSETR